jgi:hypothetical protein
MRSGLKLIRKIFGIILLVINLIVSFTSFVSGYSAVYFMGTIDENILNADSFSANLASSPEYIYLGKISLNNTGIYNLDDFEIEVKLFDEYGTWIVEFEKWFGTLPAGQSSASLTNWEINITGFNPGLDLSTVNWTNVTGYCNLEGKYAFRLFDFSLNITNMALLNIASL